MHRSLPGKGKGIGFLERSTEKFSSMVLIRHLEQFGMAKEGGEIKGRSTAERHRVFKREKWLARRS